MQLAQLGAETALQPPERGDHRRRHAIFLFGAGERRRMYPDSRLRILCGAVGRPVAGEFGEYLAEHALAAVAVDDALVVDEVGRGLGQRALRDAGRDGLRLRSARKRSNDMPLWQAAAGARAARRPAAVTGLWRQAASGITAGRAGAGAGWAMAKDERDRDAAEEREIAKTASMSPGQRNLRGGQKVKRAHHFKAKSQFNQYG